MSSNARASRTEIDKIPVLNSPKTKLMISNCKEEESIQALYFGVPNLCLQNDGARHVFGRLEGLKIA